MSNDSNIGAIPPQNLEAERALLGAILFDASCLKDARELLSPREFYLEGHADIFAAMIALADTGADIDLITLGEKLKHHRRHTSTSEIAALAGYAQPGLTGIKEHARIIVDKANARKLLDEFRDRESELRAGLSFDDTIEKLRTGINAFPFDLGAATAPRSPILVRISSVQREIVSWLWRDRIPRGKLTMFEGNPGLGKSWLTLAITTSVSRGYPLPGDGARQPMNVVLMTAEDGLADTVRPRLEDMGADLQRVAALRGMVNKNGHEDVVTLADLDVLERVIVAENPGLVIVDPVIAFMADTDTSKANEVRSLLAPLAALAEKHGCAIVAVRHLNKSSAQALYRGQGSIDFIAACRSAFVIGENPDAQEERVLCHLKSNLAPKTPSLAFTITNGTFGWKGESALTAEQVLAVPSAGDDRSATGEAVDWLKSVLESGPMSAAAVIKEAKKVGIQDKPLRSARERLAIKPKKAGFAAGWTWALPAEHAREDAQVARSHDKGIFEEKGHLRDGDGWETL